PERRDPRRDGRQSTSRREDSGPAAPRAVKKTSKGSDLALRAIKFLLVAPEPNPIHAHAAENLRFIRDAMARASEFTAVPGWGGVAMGVSAIVTAAVSGPPDNSIRWAMTWFADAAVAVVIALVAMHRKAARTGVPLWTAAPARRSRAERQ